MVKLLRACLRRYIHNVVFWITVALTLGLAFVVAYCARRAYYEETLFLGQMLIHAIMISWVVGKEFREGIFRNKAIIGHSKGNIFLSEMLSALGISFAFYLLSAIIFVAFNSYELPLLPTDLVVTIFVDYVLLNMCLSAIFVTVSCLFSHQALVAIINIALVLVMMFGSQGLYGKLSQPEGFEAYETVHTEWIDENGNIRYKEEKIEGSEYMIPNPNYIGGTKRVIYEAVYGLNPYGHINDIIYFNIDWFGYDYFMNNPTEGMTGEEMWEMVIGDNEITEETLKRFDMNLIYSCVLLFAVSGFGYIVFRKKEFK